MKATTFRANGREQDYINTINALIVSLLKKERDPVKELKNRLLAKDKFGISDDMRLYDELLEGIIDILEDSGYLTKDFIIQTFGPEIPGIED